MDPKLSIGFFKKINILDDRNYLISIIRFHAAPTLAGKKPSCLINFTNDKRSLYQLWDTYKNEISTLIDMDYYEIYRDSKRVLVLFYNSQNLEERLYDPDNMKFLQRFGYDDISNITDALEMLSVRFTWEFPHEIGILLGIPCEDVEGFLNNYGMNFIINGYWKVYSKPQRAQELFQEYDNARIDVIKSIMQNLQ